MENRVFYFNIVQIWVLTGDKKETAVNIGYSCKLLSDQMLNLTLDEANIDVSFLFEIDHFVLEMICL